MRAMQKLANQWMPIAAIIASIVLGIALAKIVGAFVQLWN